jgi:hypothetical protein
MNVPKQILEDENLETPQQSVKFLEYYQKHVDKTERQKQRLHKFSKFFMIVSALALAFIAFRYMRPAQAPRRTYGGKPRLGASNEAVDTDETASLFSGISVFIWGLVFTKAKQGMEAAGTNDSAKAGGLLKKSAGLIFMIIVASVFQLMSTHSYETSPTEAIEKVATHALQSSRSPEHTASYYDETSSHYMGGAHNVALNNLRQGIKPKSQESGHTASYYDQSSSHYLGGAHNVALQRLTNQSNVNSSVKTLPASQKTMGGAHNVAYAMLSQSRQEPLTQAQHDKNLKVLGAFFTFIVTGALCIAFYVLFRKYHLSLEKLDQLTTLFNNPNARVASGD